MRTTTVAAGFALVLAIGLPSRAAAQEVVTMGSPGQPIREATAGPLPDTTLGEIAGVYVKAFNSGNDAMKAFFTTNLSPAAVAMRPIDARMDVYRDAHENVGVLTYFGIIESSATVLEIRASGPHTRVAVRLELDPDQKDKLKVFRLQVEDERGPK